MNVRHIVRPRGWSLRSMLVASLVGFSLLGWLAGGLITAHLAARSEQRLHEREIRHLGDLLLGLSDHEIDEMGPAATLLARVAMGRADAEVLQDDYRYQLWSDEGELLLGNYGNEAPAAMAPFGTSGYSRLQMDGREWRVYAHHDAQGRRQIQIAEPIGAAPSLWGAVDGGIAALVLGSILVVLVPALWVLRRLLKPMQDVVVAVEGRTPDSLAPLATPEMPAEVAPLVTAINRLLARLAEALGRERAFTGVAAHELRTPLAAMRVLAQEVRSAGSSVERDDALDRLIVGSDRCAHLLDQLLTLQRLDASGAAELEEAVDLTDVVMEAVAAVRPLAQRREVSVGAALDGSSIRAHRFGVLTLLRNLLSNGVQYTPQGGRVLVSTRRVGDDVAVIVDDSGLGIDPADRERAFERFQRLGAKSGAGVGLGLSIVRAVAQAHAAGVELDASPLGGLRVTVRFAGRAVGEFGPLETQPPELTQGRADKVAAAP